MWDHELDGVTLAELTISYMRRQKWLTGASPKGQAPRTTNQVRWIDPDQMMQRIGL